MNFLFQAESMILSFQNVIHMNCERRTDSISLGWVYNLVFHDGILSLIAKISDF